jgi:DNA-binding transcriptional ArsR family regulator
MATHTGAVADTVLRRFSPTYSGGVNVSPSGPVAEPAQDRIFAALASPVRREVLRLLREQGPQPVAQLAAHFAMARPSFSEHLRVLRDAGLASETRVGRQRLYRLEAAPLAALQDWLTPFERFWRDRLSDLGALLDSMDDARDDA